MRTVAFPERISWALLCALAFCALSLSCTEKDDTAAIRALIEKGANSAEEHDIPGILGATSDDFRAMPGDIDRTATTGILWRAFKYYGPLRVLYPRPEVEIEEDSKRATAQVPFLIVKKEQTYPELEKLRDDPLAWLDEVGENADLYRLTLRLARQDGDWLVRHALLEGFTGVGFEE